MSGLSDLKTLLQSMMNHDPLFVPAQKAEAALEVVEGLGE